ncbi:MerR family transcriptional regulator [Streptomyces sp. NPDC060194]|uniref:MerR family transcriptional regulator n=1 Tax=Streptomyces sp. NPDC060194 TaxID=3347069 RepID=UPI00365B57EA
MITIGQLAGYVGVSTKTVRVYHDKGLLPEPERDASGYRRYDAQAVAQLVKIRTLAEAGVPLARIRGLLAASDTEFRQALDRIDDDLTVRIDALRGTQERLRDLAAGRRALLPAEVGTYVDDLTCWGFSARWTDLQRDLWILVFATHPERAADLFRDQAATLSDPALRGLFLDYDRAHGLDPDDPRIADLARRITAAIGTRYADQAPPEVDAASAVPALVQDTVNASSPAWQRLDTLIRAQLGARTAG